MRSKAQDYFEELGGGIDPELANSGNERHVLRMTEQVGNNITYVHSHRADVYILDVERYLASMVQSIVSMVQHGIRSVAVNLQRRVSFRTDAVL